MTIQESIEVITGIFAVCAPFSLVWCLAIRIYQFIIDSMTGRDVFKRK